MSGIGAIRKTVRLGVNMKIFKNAALLLPLAIGMLATVSAQAQPPVRYYTMRVNPRQTVSRFDLAMQYGYEMRQLEYNTVGMVAHGKRMLSETVPAGAQVWCDPAVLAVRSCSVAGYEEILLRTVWVGKCGNKFPAKSWFKRKKVITKVITKTVVRTQTVLVREKEVVCQPIQPVFEVRPMQRQWQKQHQKQSQSITIINQGSSAPVIISNPSPRQVNLTSRSETSVLGSVGLFGFGGGGGGYYNPPTPPNYPPVYPPGIIIPPGLPGSPSFPGGGTPPNNVVRPPSDPGSGNMFPGAPAPLPPGSYIPGGPVQR